MPLSTQEYFYVFKESILRYEELYEEVDRNLKTDRWKAPSNR